MQFQYGRLNSRVQIASFNIVIFAKIRTLINILLLYTLKIIETI
jgi:hypothetical protein